MCFGVVGCVLGKVSTATTLFSGVVAGGQASIAPHIFLARRKILFLSEIFFPKIQNLVLLISILAIFGRRLNIGAKKMKFWAPIISSGWNLQLSVGKLQLPHPNFFTRESRHRWQCSWLAVTACWRPRGTFSGARSFFSASILCTGWWLDVLLQHKLKMFHAFSYVFLWLLQVACFASRVPWCLRCIYSGSVCCDWPRRRVGKHCWAFHLVCFTGTLPITLCCILAAICFWLCAVC